ncbi:MAG: YetF domain-containing protein [Candidatus Acidiferrales bacterium]
MATIIHAVLGYVFLLLVVRVLSRRPGGQLTLFEFVIVFLIGGVVILSTVGKDRSITNCGTAILTVGLMHWGVSAIKSKFPRFGAAVDGTPLTLLKNGEWQNELLKGMKIDPEDVMAAARTKGVSSIHDVAYAILERNGAISIIKGREQCLR